MATISETLDDATRSRLARAALKAGGGKPTIYAVRHKQNDMVFLVIATHAEKCLDLIRETGLDDWTLANTSCNRVQRGVSEEQGIIGAYRIEHPHGR